jgi:hypothetical protein
MYFICDQITHYALGIFFEGVEFNPIKIIGHHF